MTTYPHADARENALGPHLVPERLFPATVLLVAGVATLATTFAALPAAVLATGVAVWCLALAWAGSRAAGTIGLTVLSVCVKASTLVLIGVLIWAPASPFAPTALEWIPLGLANMGSGLWFLKLIRGRAR